MKHIIIPCCLLLNHFFVFGQEKKGLVEVQLYTTGDVTVASSSSDSNEKGLTEESKKAAEGILRQWELPTGIKILTLKEGRGKELPPLTLIVPPDYTTQLELQKGHLTLTNLTGDLNALTQAGTLTIKQLNARVRLYTGRGDIDANESTLTGDLITQAGNISLQDVDGPVTVLAKQGTVSVKFSEAFLAKKQKEIFTYGIREGSIEAIGAIGKVYFQTGQGNIDVQKAPLGVEAHIVQKGNIHLKDVAGKLRVITALGSVFVQTLPQTTVDTEPIWLEAHQGDVTLIVPKDLTGFLTLDVAQTRDLDKTLVIDSFLNPFPPKLENITSDKGEVLGKAHQSRQLIGVRTSGEPQQNQREIVIRVRNGNVFIKSL